MKRLKSFIVFISVTLILGGCSAVTSEKIVGSTETLNPSDWDGIWISEDEAIKVKVINAQAGKIKLAWFEDKENDLLPETMVVQITKGESLQYFNVLECSMYDKVKKHFWGRIKKDKEYILAWGPSPAKFKADVQSKKLNGKIESTGDKNFFVHLRASGHNIVDHVENNDQNLFVMDEPLIFKRMK